MICQDDNNCTRKRKLGWQKHWKELIKPMVKKLKWKKKLHNKLWTKKTKWKPFKEFESTEERIPASIGSDDNNVTRPTKLQIPWP